MEKLRVQNLKIAESSVFIFSKLFDWHSSGENISGLTKGCSPFHLGYLSYRSHFHQNLKPDPLPTKRICLHSHAALTLINPLFLNFSHHLI